MQISHSQISINNKIIPMYQLSTCKRADENPELGKHEPTELHSLRHKSDRRSTENVGHPSFDWLKCRQSSDGRCSAHRPGVSGTLGNTSVLGRACRRTLGARSSAASVAGGCSGRVHGRVGGRRHGCIHSASRGRSRSGGHGGRNIRRRGDHASARVEGGGDDGIWHNSCPFHVGTFTAMLAVSTGYVMRVGEAAIRVLRPV